MRQRKLRKLARILLLLVAAVLVCRVIGFKASASSEPEFRPITAGLSYQRELIEGSEIHVLVADLSMLKPVLLQSQTPMSLSELVRRRSGVRAAINGPFFDRSGQPEGMLVAGQRISGPRHDRSSLAFTEDIYGSKAKIELYRLNPKSVVKANGIGFSIRRYNETYAPGGIGVYTEGHQASGVGIVPNLIQARVALSPSSKSDHYSGEVVEVIENPTQNLTVGPSELVLSAGNEASVALDMSAYGWAATQLVKKAWVTVDITVEPEPASLVLSGGPEFLRHGGYCVEENSNAWMKTKNARTAVGITSSGRYLLLVVVEGQPKLFKDQVGFLSQGAANARLAAHSIGQYTLAHGLGLTRLSAGMKIQDLARYMMYKDIEDEPILSAINFDGGSSSTMVVTDEAGNPTVLNDLTEDEEVKLPVGLGFVPRN